ncbi:MAG: (deoxy)nucleoside triphosphate pyrophosphohydrolase [Alphaproteobacteria bacterium GM202ARS2]|nr:(deoxy)nucleoside triphosphate pyrophosphohydrolase [Alphaproteobacteria bacterium GM202ARS2]
MLTVATCALIRQHHVLLGKRPQGTFMAGVWEFPGGKAEHNETPSQTLRRELHEELNLRLDSTNIHVLAFTSHYDKKHKPYIIILYVCRDWQGQPQAQHHDTLRWVAINDIIDYPMPPANTTLLPTLTTFMAQT